MHRMEASRSQRFNILLKLPSSALREVGKRSVIYYYCVYFIVYISTQAPLVVSNFIVFIYL